MSFRTTRRADQDIIDLYMQGSGRFGIAQADRYHAGLLALFDRLAHNPGMARLHTAVSPPVRLHAYQSRVLHGRQDWEQVLL